jgi:MoxR-like ATPase
MDIFPVSTDKIPAGKTGWLVLFDEFSSAPLSVQSAAYKIILDRKIGQHNLHPKALMMAAGNLMTDNAVVSPMSTAMQSRLIHLEMEVSLDDWKDWAYKNNVDSRIIAYVNHLPNKLHDFSPDHNDKTFPCP